MISVYASLLGAQVKGQLSYKSSFVIELFGYFVGNVIDVAAIYFLFQRFPQIRGWTMGEVYYLYGTGSIAYAIAQLFAESLEKVPEYIRSGDFDQFLTRPLPAVLQIIPHSFRLNRFGRFAQGAFALSLAAPRLGISFGPRELALFALTVGCAVFVYFGLFLGNAAFCFWTIQGAEAFNAFTYGGVEMSKYPITIYRRWMRSLFLYGIPVGFVSYYPSLLLLGKKDPLGGAAWLAFLSPLVAGLFALGMWIFWRSGVKRYQSTGS